MGCGSKHNLFPEVALFEFYTPANDRNKRGYFDSPADMTVRASMVPVVTGTTATTVATSAATTTRHGTTATTVSPAMCRTGTDTTTTTPAETAVDTSTALAWCVAAAASTTA